MRIQHANTSLLMSQRRGNMGNLLYFLFDIQIVKNIVKLTEDTVVV